ncbi:MAG: tRNA (adenosine(37)-N6)-threonylcarbamoyltransferase complex dimerization subunit type 1 TsaB [Candidatus Aminicenantes bacterium]|nr:MAG: tRNA (adenosine(37)-N6)-threonylcarbamoyltransferase complex dimerization subunit type 1 TsaB [Candidatus Aminicenantes bacterium]
MGKPGPKIEKDALVLAVDTTTPSGSVALLKGPSLLAEVNQDSPATFSERLLPTVRFLLESNELGIQDVKGFAVAVGPGSFTGIRIGLSTVKSFAYPSGKPIAPVSTLVALARKIQHPQNRLICSLLDAKKNQVYAALFESKAGGFQELIPQGVYSPDALFSRLPAHRVIHFIGSGVGIYRPLLFQYLKDKARFTRRTPYIAHEVGLIGYELLRKNEGKDIHEIEPLYLRKSQAEEKH